MVNITISVLKMSKNPNHGLPVQSIRWSHQYLSETLAVSMGQAKKRFTAMLYEEKVEIIAKAEAWARSTGKTLESAPQRGRPKKEEPAGSKPYSVILPIQDVEALKRVSKKTGESVSVLIRAAIRESLNASNGGLSVRQIAEIKELVPQGMQKSVRSTLT